MDNPQRILLIQLKRAGDVIVTTPAIGALKKKFPQAEIDFLALKSFAPLLDHHPGLTRVQIYDASDVWGTWKRIRARRYDWIFDFQSSPRSALVCLTSGARATAGYRVPFWGMVYSRSMPRPGGQAQVAQGKINLMETLAGPLAHDLTRRIFLSAEEKDWARRALTPGESPVGLIPTHRHPIRRWQASSFITLAQRLRARGLALWWFWGPGEESQAQHFAAQVPGSALIPATTLRQMAALLQRCRYVVTNDNGPMHLATAVGAPTLTIYGPTEPACWNPGGLTHRALTAAGLGCLGCNFLKCPFGHECMRGVTPEQALAQIDDLERRRVP